jgi:hypothetical protein
MSEIAQDLATCKKYEMLPPWEEPAFARAVRYTALYGSFEDYKVEDMLFLNLITEKALKLYKQMFPGNVAERMATHGQYALRLKPPTPEEVASLLAPFVVGTAAALARDAHHGDAGRQERRLNALSKAYEVMTEMRGGAPLTRGGKAEQLISRAARAGRATRTL